LPQKLEPIRPRALGRGSSLSFVYYAYYFNFYAYAEFALSLLLFLLPSQVFVLGLALAVGRINSRLLYPLLPLVLFWDF
ncbi:hypothetical protein, partial [Methanosarcina sp.]|uniref:hypothetical protein n=1 Tax=Methanosarcina sp. TaxID=2213 RepID=UPI002ABC3B6F